MYNLNHGQHHDVPSRLSPRLYAASECECATFHGRQPMFVHHMACIRTLPCVILSVRSVLTIDGIRLQARSRYHLLQLSIAFQRRFRSTPTYPSRRTLHLFPRGTSNPTNKLNTAHFLINGFFFMHNRWESPPYTSAQFAVPDNWTSGRIWVRIFLPALKLAERACMHPDHANARGFLGFRDVGIAISHRIRDQAPALMVAVTAGSNAIPTTAQCVFP
jgi:hypothetical protein